ncbi:NAD(P)/FAD-dependent oxidoreductase [Stagnimonas aquatica]|uniref:NAD(P)/FAD-dependent oxidoreductase n=1 Tax=Stagnimonas aquatica TaxID=2689987 RepID=A0A3N0UZG1_9GAMM|nr:NAD(P)/FAD-dependent oxidoreductase [Stagnimonas aquatica]ROH85628.1 NAD(P)/FAD-dependent oxidoreductase [Stagnimonas aquatica]
MDYDVLILGAGAAGLYCAFSAGQRGLRVLVLESANKPGKKILMSGGGRCNFTNLEVGPANYLSANPHFCKSALARYRPEHFIALVDKHGIAYHEKELGQLFCDDSSKQILQMLLDECAAAGVRLLTSAAAESVDAIDGGYRVQTAQGRYTASKLVVASGGLSIPTLGGSDFGYRLARQLGHSVLATRAGLVPLTLSGKPLEQWNDLSGLALPVEASAGRMSFRNQLLITHRGLSGPAILQISNYWQPGEPLRIDLFPQGEAESWLAEQQQARPASELRTVLGDLFPKRFAQRFAELHTPANKLMRQLIPAERKAIAAALHAWPISPNGTEGYRTAEVTLGGVDTRELSSTSFESKRAPGLHFIGEVVDVTGWLGGYNFHWAWASASACATAL